jgi:dimethylhistidine N-methyltransferase
MTALKPLPIPAIAEDVRLGLTASPKRLPPRLFYDARGSELFEEITRLPEYYLTRTERSILERNAADIVSAAGANVKLVELGAGSASKTCILIAALLRRQMRLEYFPLDVSPAALEEAQRQLRREFKNLFVRPLVSDYTADISVIRGISGRKLVLYIGSSIGNFEPDEAESLLHQLRRSLAVGDALLLGTDMRKSESVLLAAYDDAQGVTAAFNRNVLARINRELGGAFNLDLFRHVAVWNPEQSRIEMHLESRCAQTAAIKALGVTLRFAPGERIHTENSYKYTPGMIASLLEAGGFTLEHTWSDERGWFTVHLARA